MTLDKYLTIVECLPQEQKPCEDAISRQATIAEICRYECERKHDECTLHEGHCRLIKTLEQMPLVHAVPKTGHWEIISGNNSRCSICGVYNPPDYFNRPVIYNYCPFCGAKMEG